MDEKRWFWGFIYNPVRVVFVELESVVGCGSASLLLISFGVASRKHSK